MTNKIIIHLDGGEAPIALPFIRHTDARDDASLYDYNYLQFHSLNDQGTPMLVSIADKAVKMYIILPPDAPVEEGFSYETPPSVSEIEGAAV